MLYQHLISNQLVGCKFIINICIYQGVGLISVDLINWFHQKPAHLGPLSFHNGLLR